MCVRVDVHVYAPVIVHVPVSTSTCRGTGALTCICNWTYTCSVLPLESVWTDPKDAKASRLWNRCGPIPKTRKNFDFGIGVDRFQRGARISTLASVWTDPKGTKGGEYEPWPTLSDAKYSLRLGCTVMPPKCAPDGAHSYASKCAPDGVHSYASRCAQEAR